jgi:secretion/DNA translocation related TadE-like protein
VTAELAVALPAVTVALAAVVATVQAGVAQVTCVDAARAGARAAARGDGVEAVTRLAAQGALPGPAELPGESEVSVAVRQDGDLVRVRVTRPLRLLLPFGPRVEVSATAVSQAEQPDRVTDQEGSATVLILGICLAAFVLLAAVGGLGVAAVARHRAQSAADLAALAAADVLAGGSGGLPCTAASRVVAANGGDLAGCEVSGQVVEVAVLSRPPGPIGRLGLARARARAGPASGSSPGR